MSYEIFLAIGMFTAIVLALVVIILAARQAGVQRRRVHRNQR